MDKRTIGIVGSGPDYVLPDLQKYKETVDLWIGADRGALFLTEQNLSIEFSVGDFDSVTIDELEQIKQNSKFMNKVPAEKDETDIEIALKKAIEYRPKQIFMFGVTAGRKDHELINIQMLYRAMKLGINGKIIDKDNIIELVTPGTYTVTKDKDFPYVSFIPFSETVEGLSLDGFYYPLSDETLSWGSTKCISNELSLESGTFSHRRGILLVIKSRDSIKN